MPYLRKWSTSPVQAGPAVEILKDLLNPGSSSALPHPHSLQKFYKVVHFSLDVSSIFPEVPLCLLTVGISTVFFPIFALGFAANQGTV